MKLFECHLYSLSLLWRLSHLKLIYLFIVILSPRLFGAEIPRYFKAPNPFMGTQNEALGEGLYQRHRLTLLVFLGTWSGRSPEAVLQLNAWKNELDKRSVGVYAIFTNDSEESLSRWLEEHPLVHPSHLASMGLVSTLVNPKVPAIWIVDRKGNFIHRVERPSKAQFEELYKLVLLWTEF